MYFCFTVISSSFALFVMNKTTKLNSFSSNDTAPPAVPSVYRGQLLGVSSVGGIESRRYSLGGMDLMDPDGDSPRAGRLGARRHPPSRHGVHARTLPQTSNRQGECARGDRKPPRSSFSHIMPGRVGSCVGFLSAQRVVKTSSLCTCLHVCTCTSDYYRVDHRPCLTPVTTQQ